MPIGTQDIGEHIWRRPASCPTARTNWWVRRPGMARGLHHLRRL